MLFLDGRPMLSSWLGLVISISSLRCKGKWYIIVDGSLKIAQDCEEGNATYAE